MKLTLVLLIATIAYGQRSDTTYVQIATATTNNNLAIVLPAANNIGQPYHLLYVDFYDAPGKTCSSPVDSMSFTPPAADILGGDGLSTGIITIYTRIIQPDQQTAGNRYRMLSSAAGAFPVITLVVNGWDNVNCLANIFYSGSLGTVDIRKYADFGSSATPLVTIPINTTTTGNNLIVSQICLSCRIVVYSIVLFNQTTQTVKWRDIRKDTGTVDLMALTNWCSGCTVSLPNTNYPLFQTSIGGSLNLNLSGSTYVSGMISYKVE